MSSSRVTGTLTVSVDTEKMYEWIAELYDVDEVIPENAVADTMRGWFGEAESAITLFAPKNVDFKLNVTIREEGEQQT